MSDEERSDSVDALLAFIESYDRDRASGAQHGLVHYLKRFPGHEESIAREYLRIQDLAKKERSRSAGAQLFAGRYRLERALGKGGQGEVWLARDAVLGRAVALKLGGPSFGASTERTRLEREARIASAIEDPRICRIFSVDVADGHSYIVMEFVPGRTFAESFALREKPFGSSESRDVRRVAEIFREIAIALGLAHARGIVHRDVKPNNLMIKADGNPVVLDFGLARAVDDRDRVTMSGDVIGTPGYMAPEQIEGKVSRIGPHSDVFALGVVFFEALSLRHPFHAANDVERRARILAGDATPIRRVAPWVPSTLATIVETAIDHDPARRYADGARLAADLDAFLDDRPIAARPVSAARRAAMFVKRHRSGLARLAAVVLVAVLVVAFVDAARRGVRERERRHFEALDSRLIAAARQFDELWPKDAASAAAMDEWCRTIRGFLDELPRLRERRDELREESALPATREDEIDAGARIAEEIERKKRELAAVEARSEKYASWYEGDDRPHSPKARLVADASRLRAAVAALERESRAPRKSWRFATRDEEAEHALLCDRISRIEALSWDGASEPSLRAMLDRARFARAIAARRDGADLELWRTDREALRDSAANPSYAGVEFPPQYGLLPLGKNSRTGLFEYLHLQSGLIAGRPDGQGGDAPYPAGIVLVLLPGGEFDLGQAEEPATDLQRLDYDPNEAPPHRVHLEPFFLAKHELCQEQWEGFTGRNPARFVIGSVESAGPTPIHFAAPVEMVRYDEARRVLARFGLDLPTEAQWEYAARGGASRQVVPDG